MKCWSVFLPLILALVLPFQGHAQLDGYDEVKAPNGKVRPQYDLIYRLWQELSPAQRERLFEESKQAFEGDNYLDLLPKVVNGEEFDKIIKPGIEQRAKAIRAFLYDHYSGTQNYVSDNVIPKSVVERAQSKVYEDGYLGKLDPNQISFIYGPDIIRDQNGVLRVIEDNPGFVGGFGDLTLAYNYLVKIFPQIRDQIKHKNPSEFYSTFANELKSRASRYNGEAVMYMIPPYPDNEDKRIRKEMEANGIITITPYSRWRMKVMPDGVYMYDTKMGFEKTKRRVGYIFNNAEQDDIDPSNAEAQKKLVLDDAMEFLDEVEEDGDREELAKQVERAIFSKDFEALKDLMRRYKFQTTLTSSKASARQSKGILNAIMSGQVGSATSPGVDFIGDKEFYIYVPNLIRYYLKEEPILKNISSGTFSTPVKSKLKKKDFDKVFSDFANYVAKPTDGRGGEGVRVGPYTTPREVKFLMKEVKENPQQYMYQSLMKLSHVENLIVDMRGYALVDGNGIWVGDHLWSRGLPMDKDKNGKSKGDGKVNLSARGRELPVIINYGYPALHCRDLF